MSRDRQDGPFPGCTDPDGRAQAVAVEVCPRGWAETGPPTCSRWVLPLAVAAALAPFRDRVENTHVALIFVVTVVAVASIGNRVAGYLAALLAGVWFDFFFTEPFQR